MLFNKKITCKLCKNFQNCNELYKSKKDNLPKYCDKFNNKIKTHQAYMDGYTLTQYGRGGIWFEDEQTGQSLYWMPCNEILTKRKLKKILKSLMKDFKIETAKAKAKEKR